MKNVTRRSAATPAPRWAASLWIACALSACAGSGEGGGESSDLDMAGTAPGEGSTGVPPVDTGASTTPSNVPSSPTPVVNPTPPAETAGMPDTLPEPGDGSPDDGPGIGEPTTPPQLPGMGEPGTDQMNPDDMMGGGMLPGEEPTPDQPGTGPDTGEPGEQPTPPSPGQDGTTGGMTTQEIEPLDCGPDGWAVENHGPPENRVNYVILGDGYDATTIDTTLEEHIHTALERRFEHETGEPYGRYRKFVNICVMKVVSETNGIGNGPTAFDGGNGGDRLARVNSQEVNAYLDQNLPERLEPSWTAVVLNQDLWENTGSILMLWSGANRDAPGAALHEGGHGFHQLADEYGSCTGAGCGEDTNGSGPMGREYQEVNSTGNPTTTDGKWDLWFGSTQVAIRDPNGEATGLQSTFSGSRYEAPSSGQYRPSDNSMMNSLFGLNPNTSFNSVSREQMVFSIWQYVVPIDSTVPEPGDVSGPTTLQVNVIDPAVISVDWSVDGEVVAENGGTTFDTSVLEAGSHTVTARAYDNATDDLVRLRSGECPESVRGNYCHGTAWQNSEQTVEWAVTLP